VRPAERDVEGDVALIASNQVAVKAWTVPSAPRPIVNVDVPGSVRLAPESESESDGSRADAIGQLLTDAKSAQKCSGARAMQKIRAHRRRAERQPKANQC
jgi:hypothetical protein